MLTENGFNALVWGGSRLRGSYMPAAIRGIKARTREVLEEAIVKTIDAVTVADIGGWYREDGYVS